MKINLKENTQLLSRIKVLLLIFLLYLILNLFGMGCPIKFFTGISCPGCGMTRSVWAAMRFQFQEAFYYHPLFFLVPIIFILFLFEYRFNPRFIKYAWSIILSVFILTYIIRLTLPQNVVVYIDIYEGFMLKFIQNNILGG